MLGQNVTSKKKRSREGYKPIGFERKPVHLALCAMIKDVSTEA